MKYVLTESQYGLLKEDMGVSRASVAYSNIIYQVVEPIVLRMIPSDKEVGMQKVEKIEIGLDKLKKVWQNDVDDFLELPIEQFNISIEVQVTDEEYENITFSSGGGAYPIDGEQSYTKKPSLSIPKKILEEPEVNQTVVCKMELEVDITPAYDESYKDKMLFDLRDTIFHEMNHFYEGYNKNKRGKSMDTRLSHITVPNIEAPRRTQNYWKFFLQMMEHTQPQEINAVTQEMYSKKIRMSLDELTQTSNWKLAKYMSDFDGEYFFDALVDTMEDLPKEEIVEIMVKFWESFVDSYRKMGLILKFPSNKKIINSKELHDLITKMEPLIRKSGKTLVKRFVRLVGLEEN